MMIANTNFRPQLSASTPPPTAAAEASAPGDTVTFHYDASSLVPVTNLRLKLSSQPEAIPMQDPDQDKVWSAQSPVSGQNVTWTVVGDAADGSFQNKPLIMSEQPPSVSEPFYAPVTTGRYGVHRQGEDGIRFASWSPNLAEGYSLHVDVYNREGQLEKSLPMLRQGADWELNLATGWQELNGKSYEYSARNAQGEKLKTKDGREVAYADPVARFLQGSQRGLERIFVDPVLGFETGWYDDSGKGGPNYADNPQWGRFSVDGHANAESVRLVLRDDQGTPLTKEQLLARLGEPKLVPYDQASPTDKRDVDVLKNWQLDKTKPIDYSWADRINADGSIELKKYVSDKAGTAWVVGVNNFPQLVGLSYEFQVTENGQLVGDKNGDGHLSKAERIATPFNDPHSNVISPRPGSARRSLIRESSFRPQFQNAPRKESDVRKFVIYEAHVGSFMGSKDNAVAANFEDMINNLDYLEKLGANTIELLPTNEFCGKRDWGYTPDFYFAGAEAYGFEMKRDQAVARGLINPEEGVGQESVWIQGTEALKLFIDEAHKRGFNVLADVVYNHTSGRPDGDNPLALVDGDAKSYFRWPNGNESYTPWGAKLNYSEQGVKNFLTDNSVQQVTELGYDGIRFDFAQVLHNTGDAFEQIEGMNALRQINRTLQVVKPDTYTVAEDFSGNWLVAADLDKVEHQWGMEKKGMGFDAVWNDRFRDDIYGASEGSHEVPVDRLMDSLLNHHGVSGWDRAVLYAHSHDEVGNSGQWVARAAARSKEDNRVFESYPRSVARSAAALTLLGPGVPMLFQGEEMLANNDFKHGLTSTWGHDTDWLNFPVTPDKLEGFKQGRFAPEDKAWFDRYQAMDEAGKAKAETMAARVGHFKAHQDLIKLRGSSDAFMSTGAIHKLYTHNADRVMAYSRGSNQDFVVVTNFSGHDKHGYGINLPPGSRWKEVFNSDASAYGGSNKGNLGAVIDAHSGVMLPAGSTLVLQKVT